MVSTSQMYLWKSRLLAISVDLFLTLDYAALRQLFELLTDGQIDVDVDADVDVDCHADIINSPFTINENRT